MSAIIFVGPTLAGERPAPPGVELRPPAEAGDFYRAARGGADVIGLIDGAFEDRPTVWHKEILWALDRGVRVVGAASLGALRAAECAPFGMEGIGEIFRRCLSGALEDDHELALAYAPAELGYAPLSEPLVNVRATLEAAARARLIRSRAAAALLGHAARLPFREIGWPALIEAAPGCGWRGAEVARFAAWLPAGRVDLKRADALLLLDAIAAEAPPPERARFRFADTRYWRAAVAWFDDAHVLDPRDEAVLDELRLDPARFEREMIRAFARRAARGTSLPDGTAEQLLDDLRLDLGLGAAPDFRAWMQTVRTDEASVAAALADEERLALALDAAAPELASSLLDALKVDGRFEALDQRAADKRQRLGDAEAPGPDATDRRAAELPELIAELCARRRVSIDSDDPDDVARALGLPDRRALHRLLRRERDYRARLAEEGA
jgi:hypothetical protein